MSTGLAQQYEIYRQKKGMDESVESVSDESEVLMQSVELAGRIWKRAVNSDSQKIVF